MIGTLLAQRQELNNKLGTGGGFGLISDVGDQADAIGKLTGVVSGVVGFMTVAAGIWFIFQILIGGYTWLSSMGDKQRLEKARDRIVNALIGLVIVVAAVAVISLTGQFLGWDILDPATVIDQIQFK